jgi:hypothetical protein
MPRKSRLALFSISSIFALVWGLAAQDKIEIKKIDGVTHVLNPSKPLKGTIQLEVEKTLEINPFDQPAVTLRFVYFTRRDDGTVILYDPNYVEGHRFSPKGEYLGPLAKQGQGPGEFAPQGGFLPYFLGDDFWVFGSMKLAIFDKGGQFIREQKLKNMPSQLIDSSHYLAVKSEWNKDRTEQSKRLSLVRITEESLSDSLDRDLFRGTNLQTTIVDKSSKRGFSDTWSTPDLCFAYASNDRNVFVAVNSEYKIHVMNLQGDTLRIIEKEHKNVSVGRDDIEKILGPISKNERLKWVIGAYPDHLVTFLDLDLLPNGYLLVCRISGVLDYEMDVFDKEGKYIHALKAPAGQSFKQAKFHARGYGNIEARGDYQIYVDYRIKNLPEVFGK